MLALWRHTLFWIWLAEMLQVPMVMSVLVAAVQCSVGTEHVQSLTFCLARALCTECRTNCRLLYSKVYGSFLGADQFKGRYTRDDVTAWKMTP